MSNSGTVQRRTTYLISLTLVKVEAIRNDEGTNEETKHQSPASAPGLIQDHENGTQSKEIETKPPEDAKEPEPFEMKEQNVEIKKPSRSNSGCSIRTLPPKPKVPSYPPAVSQYKARELQKDSSVPLDDKEKRHEETEKTDTSKTDQINIYRPDLFILSTEKTPDDVVSNGTSFRPSVPIRLIQRPETTLRHQATVTMNRREFKDASKTISSSTRNLDLKPRDHSPPVTITMTMGPYRASWSESEGRGMYQRLAMEPLMVSEEGIPTWERPRVEKLNTISTSLPAAASTRPPTKPQRKGKSRTLDNSDLNLLSEDLKKGKEGHGVAGHRPCTQATGKDRKMLKFISGIFTKSSQFPVSAPMVPATPIPLHSPMRRRSSEDEVSQEWLLSRALQDLHLAVLGGLHSGKSALVHCYMTGRYLSLETPEVCRFEKEVLIDGQNHSLLIRDDPGLPDEELCSWLDGVILVFSLENESSFLEVYNIYRELCVKRNIAEIPFIVVGTQDKITSVNPRVIDDTRARQLCSDVHRCVYYETCATYGLNVNRVFTDAAQKMISMKRQMALYTSCKSLPNSPSHSGGSTPLCAAFTPQTSNGGQSSDYSSSLPSTPVITHKHISMTSGGEKLNRMSQYTLRRGSDSDGRSADGETDYGIGRTIPIKQSVLLKRTGSSLKQEWKKKYVTLTATGTLSYHANVSDYMQNVNGKEIDLLRVTVKVPGKRPPRAVSSAAPPPGLNGTFHGELTTDDTCSAMMLASTHVSVDDGAGVYGQRTQFTLSSVHNIDIEGVLVKDQSTSPTADRKKQRRKKNMTQRSESTLGHAEAKRKMWKLKSFGSLKNINRTEDENCEFQIVSSSGQTWHFEAQSSEERDSWVQNIESQILASLQSCESSRHKARRNSLSEAVAIQAVRNAKGNAFCVDCDAPNPTWASLNLGALICIECSGIHRNLGTHLSRVRSLDLDDWPYELALVLVSIGNHMTNSIWENRTRGRQKPRPGATREEREAWIRGKYEQKLFLAPLSDGSDTPLSTRLHAAVIDRDLPRLLLLLAHSTKEEINAPPLYMTRYGGGAAQHGHTPLHTACQLGDVVMTQLLIWYGSDVRSVDSVGQTALAVARRVCSQVCVELLLQYGCPSEISPTISSASITSPSGAASPTLSRNSSSTSLSRGSTKRHLS